VARQIKKMMGGSWQILKYYSYSSRKKLYMVNVLQKTNYSVAFNEVC